MKETVLLSIPVSQFERIIIDCVNACLESKAKEMNTPNECVSNFPKQTSTKHQESSKNV